MTGDRCHGAAAVPPAMLAGPPSGWALFLDLDGTLYDLAETPDGVPPDPAVARLLDNLCAHFGGAVAVVSGRGLADIDRLVWPFRGPAAALHGLVRRGPDHSLVELPVDRAALQAVAGALRRLAEAHPRLLVEDKGRAIALHYRRAPDLEKAVQEAARDAVAPYAGRLVLQPGKMVVEVRPEGADKGVAVAAFLEAPPFSGRRPVMVGDDLTDEHGFAAAKAAGGLAIRVGQDERPSAATHRLPDVAALRRWLAGLVGGVP